MIKKTNIYLANPADLFLPNLRNLRNLRETN